MLHILIPKEYQSWLPKDNHLASQALEQAIIDIKNQVRVPLKKKQFGKKTVYTLAVNTSGFHRLVFERVHMMPSCAPALVLRGIALHHNYQKALTWDPLLEVDERTCSEVYLEPHNIAVDVEKIEQQDEFYYANQWLQLTQIQRSIVSSELKLPHLIMGPPGSGKTLVSLAFFQERVTEYLQRRKQGQGEESLNLLYLSPQPRLNTEFIKSWNEWLSLVLDKEEDRANIHLRCMTFSELTAENMERPDQRREVEEQASILAIIEGYLHLHKNTQLSANEILDELVLSSYILNVDSSRKTPFHKSQYKALGVNQTGVSQEHRELIYDVYGWLANKLGNRVYPGLSANSSLHPLHHFTCVDEMQSASVQDLLHALYITIDGRVLYCGDSYQRGGLKLSSFSLLAPWVHSLSKLQLEHTLMPETHRLRHSVAHLCSELVLLTNTVYDGKTDKKAYSKIPISSFEDAPHSVNWVEPSQANWESLGNDATVATLVLNPNDVENAKNKFGALNIFEVNEARGLQFPKVLVYISEQSLELFVGLNQEMEARNITPEYKLKVFEHTSKRKGVMHKSSDFQILSALFVALSRSFGEVWIFFDVQTKKQLRDLEMLLSWLKSRCLGTNVLEAKASTLDEWLDLIHQLINQEIVSKAQVYLTEHFQLSSAQAEQYISIFRQSKIIDVTAGLEAIQLLKTPSVKTTVSTQSPASSSKTPVTDVSPQTHAEVEPEKPACISGPVVNVASFVGELLNLGKKKAGFWFFHKLTLGNSIFEQLFLNQQNNNALEIFFQANPDNALRFVNATRSYYHKEIPDKSVTYFQFMVASFPLNMAFGAFIRVINTAFPETTPQTLNASLHLPKAPENASLLYLLLRRSAECKHLITPNLVKKITPEGLYRAVGDIGSLAYLLLIKQDYTSNPYLPALIKQIYARLFTQLVAEDGTTPFYHLFSYSDGRKLISLYFQFLKQLITTELLMQQIPDRSNKGLNIFYLLLRAPEGRKLVSSQQEFFMSLITKELLHQSITDEETLKGATAFYCLCSIAEGRQLIISQWKLFKLLITKELLLQPITGEGSEKNTTALYWLCCNREGLKLISSQWEFFKPFFTLEILQQGTGENTNRGATIFYCLCAYIEGLQLMISQWECFNSLITKEILHQSLTYEGQYKGSTPFYCLCSNLEGIQLMKSQWEFFKTLITKELLHQKKTGEGKYKGSTAFYCLSMTQEGRQLIISQWAFFKPLITTELLHQLITGEGQHKGLTVFYWLWCTPEGRQLVISEWEFLITKESLQKPLTEECTVQGATIFSMICSSSEGLQLVRSQWDFFNELFTKESLRQQITGEGSFKGASIFYWLCAYPEGQDLLQEQIAFFKPLVTEDLLDLQITGEGPNQGTSARTFLSETQLEQEFLTEKKATNIFGSGSTFFPPALNPVETSNIDALSENQKPI